ETRGPGADRTRAQGGQAGEKRNAAGTAHASRARRLGAMVRLGGYGYVRSGRDDVWRVCARGIERAPTTPEDGRAEDGPRKPERRDNEVRGGERRILRRRRRRGRHFAVPDNPERIFGRQNGPRSARNPCERNARSYNAARAILAQAAIQYRSSIT